MKFLILIACLVACVMGDGSRINGPECGRRLEDIYPRMKRNDDDSKIIGGRNALPGDYGWQIAVNISRGAFNTRSRFACGGTLINNEWIMTSTECADDYGTYRVRYEFVLGLHRLNPENWAEGRRPIKYVEHPRKDGKRNDIGLFKIAPVKYTDKILPVCLPNGEVDYSERRGWATGWGKNYYNGEWFENRFLQEIRLPILTSRRCKKKFPRVYSDVMLCGGDNEPYFADTCSGDGGGPLVVKHISTDPSSDNHDGDANMAQPADRWYQVGITSWGANGCGDGTVFTRTSAFYSWIKETIRNN